MLKGCRLALKSDRCHSNLRAGIQRLAKRLEGKIALQKEFKKSGKKEDLIFRLFGF